MSSKFGIGFLGLAAGGVTFLITGLALYLVIAQFQYQTLARATQISHAPYAQVALSR